MDFSPHEIQTLGCSISGIFYSTQAARHPMLLLVGPPGCGKTATLFTLAKEMGCTILEWVNPVSDVGGSEAGVCFCHLAMHMRSSRVYRTCHTPWQFLIVFYADPQPGDLVVYPESQTSQFRNFLVRANRYPCLQVGGASGCGQQQEKKIVVVEVSDTSIWLSCIVLCEVVGLHPQAEDHVTTPHVCIL